MVSLVLAVLVFGSHGQAAIAALYFCLAVYTGANLTPRPARSVAMVLCVGLVTCLHLADTVATGLTGAIYAVTLLVVVEGLSRVFSRLRVDATTDALTGLRNRLGLLEECNREIAVCRRMGQPISILHIDLDGFKQINDSSGHAEGDRILVRCAETWRRQVRAGDILARIGGDEFLAVLPGSNKQDAESLVRRLVAVSPVDWCCGIAELDNDESFSAALARADRELYAAKAARQSAGQARNREQASSPRTLRTQKLVRDAGAAFG